MIQLIQQFIFLFQHNSENNNIPQVITRVIERTVTIEPEKVVLKFKDNKHKNYEIETYIKRRFYDVFNELIGRHDLKKNEIISRNNKK